MGMSRSLPAVVSYGFLCVRVTLPPLPPQVMQGLAWVVSTVLLKLLLSTLLCASDDVRFPVS